MLTSPSKIICGECGCFYGSKVWHSTSKYRRTIWQCNGKYGQHAYCSTPHLTEDEIQQAFVRAFNRVFEERDRLVEDYAVIIKELDDLSQLDAEIAKLQSECEIATELMRTHIEGNARKAQGQSEYQQQYNAIAGRYDAAHRHLNELLDKKQDRVIRGKSIQRFMDDLQKQDALLTGFDEELWVRMVES